MRNLIIAEFITLDGVIQAPGGAEEDTDGGFTHGGWTMPYWDDAIGAHFFEAMTQADALLLGRKTWEGHGAAFNPMPDDDPFGGAMNAVRKYVVSTTLTSTALWRNSTIISSNVVEEIRKLKQQDGKNIMLDGSSVLAHTLIENDLVDEYALHIYPLVLGGGKRLFPDGKRLNLALIDSEKLASGVVYQRYRPA
ncbi:MAG: dihydrofolate reductase [Chloroflexi bacterium]|nr:dihydrofolate reductase [Chloroflexota bacterium]